MRVAPTWLVAGRTLLRAVTRTITIEAPPLTVWETMADVERWPSWASSMRRLERIGGSPLGLGSRTRVTPKWLPSNVWMVTEFDPPHSYTWTTRLAPGLGLTGGHIVDARGAGAVATFSLAATGPLATPAAPLLRAVFRRNTRLAAEGLKRYCEARR
jgi:hypothetical protein